MQWWWSFAGMSASPGDDKQLRLARVVRNLWRTQKQNARKTKTLFVCDLCSKSFLRRGGLAQHITAKHSDRPETRRRLNYVWEPLAGLPTPESALCPPSVDALVEQRYDRDVVGLVRQNWRFCATTYRTGPIHKRYNIRLVPRDGFDAQRLGQFLRAIHANQTQRYKLNFSFAMILWNQTEKKFRFYWPGNAAGGGVNSYYSSPVFINCADDLEQRIKLLDSADIMEHASLNRPDTRWIVHSLVNLHVSLYTNSLGGPLMGASGPTKRLPGHLLKSRSIRTMFHDRNGRPYNDEMCFFRCVSHFLDPKNENGLQTDAHRLSRKFSQYLGLGERDYTGGVSMENIMQAEKLFKIRIFIYSLQNERHEASAVRLRSCLTKREASAGDMFLDLYQFGSGSDHLSLITNFAAYCKSYSCGSCGYSTTRLQKLKTHERSCQSSPEDRVRGKGGAYAPSPTVFDKLAHYGISVLYEDKFSPFYSTWDLETFNEEIAPDLLNRNSGLVWESELQLLSCAVASNVPQYSEMRFFRRTTDDRRLVEEIVDYMISVSEEASRLNRLRLSRLFDSIDEKIEHFKTLAANGDEESELADFAAARIDEFTAMRTELEKFADKHAFFSFNGSRFDVKVVRNRLCNVLLDKGIKIERIIKRDNAYVMLATEKMMFKDVCCYLGPGISLDQWVRSYRLPVNKSIFPYEFVDSVAVLDQTELPPRSAFYSSLKQSDVSEQDYQELQRTYKEKGWRCLWDMLEDYNKNDSTITLEALRWLVEFWKGVGFDLITEACSLPGLAVRLANKLTPSNKPFVQIPSQSQYEMHTWALGGVVGGPSIVYRQLACANVTAIRQGPNICRRLIGFDANALYLHAMAQPMPTSLAYRWSKDGGVFKKTVCLPQHVSIGEVEFCMYLQHSLGSEEGSHLCWYFQHGQKKLGKKRRYSCDAVSFRLNTVYSYDGCFYHFCKICPSGRRAAEKNAELAQKRQDEDKARDLYIAKCGMRHVQMSECRWREMRKQPEIRKFLQEMLHTPQWGIGQLSENQLLSAVRQKRFFGLLEVKMDCPDNLMEYFEECAPLFQNILLGRQHLNAEMLEVAEQNELLKQPRKSLVAVRSADSIILASPLLNWLLDHGMVCSTVHKAYEFKPFPLYKDYCDEVTRQRRLGDLHPHQKPISDGWKVAGNGSFGRSLMRVDRFTKTVCCDAKRASKSINQKTFRQLEALGDDRYEMDVRYEVTTLPRTFHETTPRCIGIFILNFAKLVILQFYFDSLDKFWFRDDFELVYSDTDSWYISISSPSWQEHEKKIKPGMEAEYWRVKPNFLEGPANARQPGVFKIEYEGELCVALCSKSYLCAEYVTAETAERCRRLLKDRTGQVWNAPEDWRPSETDGSTKISAKGTNKKQNADQLRIDKFLDVLETKQAAKVCNRGFRAVDGKVFKYSLTKTGLSYFYGKRKLNPDFTTSPLW